MYLLPASVFAEKHLSFLDGYLGWSDSMPSYLVANHIKIEKLPAVVGDVYTSFDYNHHEQLINNLKQGATYHYRVTSEDAEGHSVTSGDHTFTTSGVNAGTTALPTILSFLLDDASPFGTLVPRPSYGDAANIPELGGGWYGAMGEHPVRRLTMASPWPSYVDNHERDIDLFYPSDVVGKKPTVFFISGWGKKADTYRSLLYFIASQGFNVVFIPYTGGDAIGNPDVLLDIMDGVVNSVWNSMIDTTKVGYSGHSSGGGLTFFLAQQRPNWGTEGRFIFSIAAWWGFHLPVTGNLQFPANTNMIVQVSHDDSGTDPRQNIDFFIHNNINAERKSYLYLPGDVNHASDHYISYSVDENGEKINENQEYNGAYYFDALEQVGLYRPLESLMRYSFGTVDGETWKAIGLPDAGDANYNVLHAVNGISMLSTDNPLANHIFPIPVEQDLNDSYLCSKHINPRWKMCMPCKDTSRDQAWVQCQ